MNKNLIVKLFDALDNIVDEDHTPWSEKKKEIEQYLKHNERAATNWEEFFSWFLPDEE